MNMPLNRTGHNAQSDCGEEQSCRAAVPAPLNRQCRLAAVLLLGLWLLSVSAVWSAVPSDLKVVASLLPGLAVTFYILRQLVQHLLANHPPDNKDLLYATLGAANWITLARAGGIIVLAGFLPLAILVDPAPKDSPDYGVWAWIPGVLYLSVALADLLDGYIARKQNHETELGQKLDMATDGAGLLIASLLAVALGRLPIAYLLVGMAYYLYTFGIWLRRHRALPVIAWRARPYARIIAGCQMGLLAMVLLPIFHRPFSFIAGYLFMTPLLLGFVRDWLVISGRLATDGNQQARIDEQVRSLMQWLSPILRLLLMAGAIVTVIHSPILPTQMFWLTAFCLCFLMASLGFFGRSAALVLVLLLGSNISPFGISLLSITIFSIAVILTLAGTGRLSLWAPEEALLYRDKENGGKMTCEAI